jgi:NitT/TauT family transport system ATP-binding protein
MFKVIEIYKSYSNNVIFEKFNIEIEEHKISCILGTSGIGKTTLLNIISGLIPFDSGNISDFYDRQFSYIFQEPRLLEWKTVYGNILFVLKDLYPKKESHKITNRYIDLVGLTDYKDYYPFEISGGMEQRVSIARAFAYPSEILIMDEPFKSLDFKLKNNLMNAFIDLWEIDKRTVIFVTHDIDEASYLGNKIFILNNNKPVDIKHTLSFNESPRNRLANPDSIKEIKKQLFEIL